MAQYYRHNVHMSTVKKSEFWQGEGGTKRGSGREEHERVGAVLVQLVRTHRKVGGASLRYQLANLSSVPTSLLIPPRQETATQ